MSIEAVCEVLGCGRSRVFELLADGTLARAPRFGRRLRIYRASVERALAPKTKKRRAARSPAAPTFTAASFADLTS